MDALNLRSSTLVTAQRTTKKYFGEARHRLPIIYVYHCHRWNLCDNFVVDNDVWGFMSVDNLFNTFAENRCSTKPNHNDNNTIITFIMYTFALESKSRENVWCCGLRWAAIKTGELPVGYRYKGDQHKLCYHYWNGVYVRCLGKQWAFNLYIHKQFCWIFKTLLNR